MRTNQKKTFNTIIAVIGGGSGLGEKIVQYELKNKNKVISFSSKKYNQKKKIKI